MGVHNATGFKMNATTTAKELQSFVASLKGKSAADAMGTVARSHLLQALVISAIAQVVIVLALTVPFALFPKKIEVKEPVLTTPKRVATPANPANGTQAAATTGSATTAAPATAGTTGPTTDTINRVMKTDMVKPEEGKTPDIEDLMKNLR